MAVPGATNGFIKVPNSLMDALVTIRIPGEARQVFDLIMRKTLGYNKAVDVIALSQFCRATGIRKTHISRALDKLQQMNLITIKGNGNCTTYRINQDFSSWRPLPKKGNVPQKGKKVERAVPAIPYNGKNPYPIKGNTKDNIKDTVQKTVKSNEKMHTDIDMIEYAALIKTPALEIDTEREGD